MKRYKLFFAVALLSLATACSKESLNTSPTDQIAEDVVFSSLPNTEKALNGIYRALYAQYGNQHRDGQGAMMILMDAMGEDYVRTRTGYSYHRGAYRWEDHRNPSSTNVTLFAWRFYYIVIGNANKILDYIDDIEGEPDRKARIKAEALTLRAWAHHYLVQLYSKRYVRGANNDQPGIPVMTTTTLDGVGRGTVEDVYRQINEDLDNAVTLFQSATARNNKTHVNIHVARGVKARVLLTQHRYAEAAAMAKTAREGFAAESGGGDGLMSQNDYLGGFTDLSNVEWMWGVQQLSDQVPTYGSFYGYMSSNFNSGFTRTNPKCININLWSALSATDVRKKLFWDGTPADKVNFPGVIDAATGTSVAGQVYVAYQHRKYVVPDYTNRAGDIPFMRIAEMYLIEAEAYARNEQWTAAQDILFDLVSRRDLDYVKSTNTGTALVDEIMLHRRAELWGEGFRFVDLKRTSTPLDRTGSNHTSTLANIMSVTADSDMWQWMIPQDEINANPFMSPADQNL